MELTASEQPQLLEFQAHLLRSGTMSFATLHLAAELDVPPDQLGNAFYQASQDLDRLEKHRGRWRDPAEVLRFPNSAVLRSACQARLKRVPQLSRRRRLERILRRVDAAYQLARTRAWVKDFIGPPAVEPREAEG